MLSDWEQARRTLTASEACRMPILTSCSYASVYVPLASTISYGADQNLLLGGPANLA